MAEEQKYKTLIVEGVKYQTTFTKKFENRVKWERPNENMIYSFIPGSVIDIYIKTGQKVKEGESIMILEAMKMHNNLLMPFDGQIVKIHVKKDQIVPKNFLLLEIKPL